MHVYDCNYINNDNGEFRCSSCYKTGYQKDPGSYTAEGFDHNFLISPSNIMCQYTDCNHVEEHMDNTDQQNSPPSFSWSSAEGIGFIIAFIVFALVIIYALYSWWRTRHSK
jgi:hypothetical protein